MTIPSIDPKRYLTSLKRKRWRIHFRFYYLNFLNFVPPFFLRKKILKRQERRMRKGMRRIDLGRLGTSEGCSGGAHFSEEILSFGRNSSRLGRDGQKEEEEEMAKSRLTSESCPYQTTYRAFFSNLVPPLTAHFPLPPPLSLFFSSLPLFPLDSFYTPSRILVLLDCLKKKTQTTSRFRSPRTKA